MKKMLTATVAAATLATAVMLPSDASAQRRWRGPGPAVVGGFVAGAIVGSALASRYYYPRTYYYAPGPTYYYAPGPVQYEYYYDP